MSENCLSLYTIACYSTTIGQSRIHIASLNGGKKGQTEEFKIKELEHIALSILILTHALLHVYGTFSILNKLIPFRTTNIR